MHKKKVNKKKQSLYIPEANVYALGDLMNVNVKGIDYSQQPKLNVPQYVGPSLGQKINLGLNTITSSPFANVLSGATGLYKSIDNAAGIIDTSNIEDSINNQANYISAANSNEDILNEWSTFSPMGNVTQSDIYGKSGKQQVGNILKGAISGATAGSVGGPVGTIIGGIGGLAASAFSTIAGRNKAKREAEELNAKMALADRARINTMTNRADYIDNMNDALLLANYAANGGGLSRKKDYGSKKKPYPGVSKGDFAGGGRSYPIPTKEDAIDALRLAGLHGRSDVRAKVYAKYPSLKKALGGPLYTNGANWDNGIILIGNGDTHENNINGGVQIGVDQEGKPNLVEEGEVIWNDYVFSNRLKPTKKMKDDLKLTGDTFADIAKSAMKESEERPNDPISKRGVNAMFSKIAVLQEGIRQKEQQSNVFAEGGDIDFDYYINSGYDKDDIYSTKQDILDRQKLEARDYISLGPDIEPSIVTAYKENPIVAKPPITKEQQQIKDKFDIMSSFFKETPYDKFTHHAPTIGSAIAVANDIFGGSDPNFTRTRELRREANKLGRFTPVGYTPIGGKMAYRPMDTEYAQNRLNAIAGATNRALLDTAGGNRAVAQAGLLSSGYNAQTQSGALARQAAESNLANKMRVAQYNLGIDQANAQGLMQTAMANQRARQAADSARYQGIQNAVNMENALIAQANAVKSANASNLFTNLGNEYKDKYNRKMNLALASSGVYGTLNPYMNQMMYWGLGNTAAKGGKIKRKKKGLTI